MRGAHSTSCACDLARAHCLRPIEEACSAKLHLLRFVQVLICWLVLASMRICHGLSGEVLEVEGREVLSGEGARQRVADVAKRRACERWGGDAEDLIVLLPAARSLAGSEHAAGATDATVDSTACGGGGDVFVFSRGALSAIGPGFSEAGPELYAEARDPEVEEAGAYDPEDELLRLRAAAGDAAVENFRDNIAEARRRILEARPVVAMAARAETRVEVQRLAAQAVLDNLASQRSTCSRSLSLFLHKYERVQEKLVETLGQMEASWTSLQSACLHPAMRSPGRETLADVVPRDRIFKFTATMQAERERLAKRLEKLQQRHVQVQTLGDQVEEKLRLFSREDGVGIAARTISGELARVEKDLLPTLCACVPLEGAPSPAVLEEEKRSRGFLEALARACEGVSDMQADLHAAWGRQRANLLQRLREVSYVQSKIRDVERQAVLLEEEINAQRNCAQQLEHLRRMPKAYQKMLGEIARRRNFRVRYVAQCENFRSMLVKMMEDENGRRRDFVQHFGRHLPADLLQGLGSLVPAVSVEVPAFDVSLPEIDFSSLSPDAFTRSARGEVSAAAARAATLTAAAATAPGAAAHPCPGVGIEGGGRDSVGRGSSLGPGGRVSIGSASSTSGSSRGPRLSAGSTGLAAACATPPRGTASVIAGGGGAAAAELEALEARNRALEAEVACLRELAGVTAASVTSDGGGGEGSAAIVTVANSTVAACEHDQWEGA